MHRTRLASVAALAVLALLPLSGTPACAQGVPDPRFSFGDLILVGNASGTPIGGAPAGFDVNVRDVNNAPIVGGIVTIDFSATTIRLYSVQTSGTTVDCAARTLSRVTNAQGAVKFAARIGGFENSNAVLVYIPDGWPPYQVRARSTDIDGLEGKAGLNDFTLFAANFLGNQAAQETDFDMNGVTGLGDYAMFTPEFLGGVAGTYCP